MALLGILVIWPVLIIIDFAGVRGFNRFLVSLASIRVCGILYICEAEVLNAAMVIPVILFLISLLFISFRVAVCFSLFII